VASSWLLFFSCNITTCITKCSVTLCLILNGLIPFSKQKISKCHSSIFHPPCLNLLLYQRLVCYEHISEAHCYRLNRWTDRYIQAKFLFSFIYCYWLVSLQLSCVGVVILCVFVILCVHCCFSTLDTGLPARNQYSEGPATGHLDTGFSWFPCVHKQMLRWFPTFQVATTCFSCSPPDLNLLVMNFVFCIHVK